jgi:septal ring factor EnvC (AmiA/AmiB activator)
MKTIRTLLFSTALAIAANGHGVESDDKEARSQLEALKERITELGDKLLQRNSEVDDLSAELQNSEQTLAQTNKRIADLDGEVDTLEEELSLLAERKTELENRSLAQKNLIAREVRSAYRQGSSEPVRLLLNQEDPQKLARILTYYRYFAEARREKIDDFTATLNDLASVETAIKTKQHDLLSRRKALVKEAETLATEQEQRSAILASLNAALSSDKAQLDKLNQERKALEQVIARLEQQIQTLANKSSTPFAKLRGKLPWPVMGKIRQGFGSHRAQSLKWTGWLIAAEEGTPVNPVHNGRVVFADYLRGQGMMVIVDHGGGYLSLYAHNQVLLKETGDWVQAGDKIALAGNSGGLSDSALYFEIRHNGKPQDPKVWLSAQR